MADRPTVTTLSSGALYNTTTLNTNFTALRDAFDTVLGLNGTSGSNNTMTGDVDWANKILRNATFDTPASTVATNPDGSAGAPAFSFTSDTNTGMYLIGADNLGFSAGGVVGLSIQTVSSGVNYVELTPAVTTASPIIAASGSDTNIGMRIRSKGDTSDIVFENGSGDTLFTVDAIASAVNSLTVTPSVTTADVSLDAVGSDTNIDIAVNPKGTGGVVVGAATGGGQGTDTVNAAGLFINGVAVGTPDLPRSYLAGLALTNDTGDQAHDISVAVGDSRDDADTENLKLSSAIIKQIDAAWAVGTNQGGLDTGSVTTSTWYAVWLIKRTDTDVVDVLFSTSFSSPTMPTNYDKKRRIGAVLTDGSANILEFWQDPNNTDYFWWRKPVLDYNGNSSTTAVSRTISSPPNTIALIASTHASYAAYYSGIEGVDNDAPSTTTAPLATSGPSSGANVSILDSRLPVPVNASSQIRTREGGVENTKLIVHAWIDRRGRDA